MKNRFSKTKPISKTLVVVAMSGGVDSSTVAALLNSEGYKVIGITLQLYDVSIDLKRKGACCAGQDIYDAKRVAENLGIKHYVLNYEDLFKESVIDDFVDSYVNGETPIPCIKCNQTVKFRDLLKFAKDLGADALATGHYVKKTIDGNGISELRRGADNKKDQSYFLFTTTKEQLDYIYFPLGDLNKDKTRQLAKKFGLDVADKQESQDICFVSNGSYRDVIAKFRPGALDDGNIVHIDGRVMGKHNGIINFTVGQRRGLGISNNDPLYVTKIDVDSKTVFVGPREALDKKSFEISGINWLVDTYSKLSNIAVKVRSTHEPLDAEINFLSNDRAKITLLNPEYAITPGQACVVYDGDRILGGGWITKNVV